jgi:hypothetical protein
MLAEEADDVCFDATAMQDYHVAELRAPASRRYEAVSAINALRQAPATRQGPPTSLVPPTSPTPPMRQGQPASMRPSSRPHDRFVALQHADGSWAMDDEFARAVSIKFRDLKRAVREATGDPEIARRALATAIAITWLERHAGDTRDEWVMLAEKARRWLAGCGAAPRGGDSWLDVAERVLR